MKLSVPHCRLSPLRRAYKLGKKRWSYNQVELRLADAGGTRRAVVKQTAHAADTEFPAPSQASQRLCVVVWGQQGQQSQAQRCVLACTLILASAGALCAARPCIFSISSKAGGCFTSLIAVLTLRHVPLCIMAVLPALYLALQDSATCFHVQLESGHKLQAHLYVVYDQQPPEVTQQQEQQDEEQKTNGGYTW